MDELLKLLEEHGRAEPEELANRLNASPDEIRRQIKEYEEQGVIQGYKAIINYEELPEHETPVVGLIELQVSPQPDTGFDSVAREVYAHPEVRACYLCSGDYDLLVKVQGDDLREVAEFVARELAPNPNIQGTVSHFLLKAYKDDGIRFDESTPDQRLSISL